MSTFRALLIPPSAEARDWRIPVVSAAIALIGSLVFRWGVADVVILFFFEMMCIGAGTALRMLFAGRMKTGGDGLVIRLLWTAGFCILYSGMLMLMMGVVLVNLDVAAFMADMGTLRYSFWLMAANHLYAFIGGYLLNGEYRQSYYAEELFATMFYALPTAVVLVIIIAPGSNWAGEEHKNTLMAAGIVVLRLAMDWVSLRMREWIRFNRV